MGCFILSGIDTVGLLQAVDTAVEMVASEPSGGALPVPDYVDGIRYRVPLRNDY